MSTEEQRQLFVELVQVLRGQHDLRGVEAGALVRVRPPHEIGVHVAALDVVETEAPGGQKPSGVSAVGTA